MEILSIILTIGAIGFFAYKFYNEKLKNSQSIPFIKSKAKISSKEEKVKEDTPDEVFNAIIVDFNKATAQYKEGVNPEEHGHVLNPDVHPIVFENTVKMGVPIRFFQKKLSRDLTGFLLKPDYKLNVSAPELVRVLKMKVLRAFLVATKGQDNSLIFISLIIGFINLLALVVIYDKISKIGVV